MPIKIGNRKYKTFARAKTAIKRRRGLSDRAAAAYVAAIERRQGKDPRTGKRIRKRKGSRRR